MHSRKKRLGSLETYHLFCENLKVSGCSLEEKYKNNKVILHAENRQSTCCFIAKSYFLYLFCEIVDDPGQCLCHHLGVSAELLHIYMRPVGHKHVCGQLKEEQHFRNQKEWETRSVKKKKVPVSTQADSKAECFLNRRGQTTSFRSCLVCLEW